ncbi:MAG: hypothetical protein J0L63_19940 [Anaerolineae bacterium]|nr:hypothetical protein [Anaerolineae bacterium]
MSIQVHWSEKYEHIIIYKMQGAWTWAEYAEAFKEELNLVNQQDTPPYDVIADLLEAIPFPGLSGLNVLYTTYQQSPQTLGTVILVSRSTALKQFVRFAAMVFPDMTTILVVSSLAQAYDVILHNRQKQNSA